MTPSFNVQQEAIKNATTKLEKIVSDRPMDDPAADQALHLLSRLEKISTLNSEEQRALFKDKDGIEALIAPGGADKYAKEHKRFRFDTGPY